MEIKQQNILGFYVDISKIKMKKTQRQKCSYENDKVNQLIRKVHV